MNPGAGAFRAFACGGLKNISGQTGTGRSNGSEANPEPLHGAADRRSWMGRPQGRPRLDARIIPKSLHFALDNPTHIDTTPPLWPDTNWHGASNHQIYLLSSGRG